MRGVTLVELLVVVVILGLISGVSGLAFTSLRLPRESATVHAARVARAEAIRTGRPVALRLDSLPRRPVLLFLPDGRAVGPGVDPLTGDYKRAPH
jgi:prepilin-type N-terminal cleavage/methylation domain-containing protein